MIGALAKELRKISAVEPPDYNRIVEAIIELDRQGEIEARKYEGTVPIRLNQAVSTEQFFFTGDFRLRLTHAGRKRLEKLPPPEPTKEQIGFRPA